MPTFLTSMPAALWRAAGPDRREVFDRLLTNDLLNLPEGQAAMACLLTAKGKLVSPMLVVERGQDFLVVCPVETEGSLKAALEKYLTVSETALIEAPGRLYFAVGPEARAAAEGAGPAFAVPEHFWGARGWAALAPTRMEPGPFPAWTDAQREAARVEGGVPKFGVDIADDVYPTELGWEFLLDEEKGCYVGQEITARLRSKGQAHRRLARLKLTGRVRPGDPLSWNGEEVGRLTSVSPEKPVGLSLIARTAASSGQVLKAPAGSAEVLG